MRWFLCRGGLHKVQQNTNVLPRGIHPIERCADHADGKGKRHMSFGNPQGIL